MMPAIGGKWLGVLKQIAPRVSRVGFMFLPEIASYVSILRAVGVADDVIRYELFEATHSGIDYRYPMSLAWLCQRMAAAGIS